MLSRSFFPNFGQGPVPKLLKKALPVFLFTQPCLFCTPTLCLRCVFFTLAFSAVCILRRCGLLLAILLIYLPITQALPCSQKNGEHKYLSAQLIVVRLVCKILASQILIFLPVRETIPLRYGDCLSLGTCEEKPSFPRHQIPSDYSKCFKHKPGIPPVSRV